jgi:hypothetical protein
VFENLENGLTIDQIVKMFDGLSREQVRTVLDFARTQPEGFCFYKLMLILFEQGAPVELDLPAK